MPVRNADIAAAFEEIADLLELGGANPFRVRAYRNAARLVGAQRRDLAGRLAAGEALPRMFGIGPDLAGKIGEIAARGTCKLLEELRAKYPAGVRQLLGVPGLGPKRVGALLEARIDSLDKLRRAAGAKRLRELPGFGAGTEKKLLEAAAARLSKSRRYPRELAARYAEPIARYLGGVVAGSFRRKEPTVGDLDFVVASGRPARVIERFVAHPQVKAVIARGTTRASVRLADGLQADLRVVPKHSFGAALHYFTGSRAHNIRVRRLGQRRGLKINEYGVWRGRKRVAGETEESVYAAVGLPYVEPEQRR